MLSCQSFRLRLSRHTADPRGQGAGTYPVQVPRKSSLGTSSRNVLVNSMYGRRNGYPGLDAHGGLVYFGGFLMALAHDEPLSNQYSDHRTIGLTGGN